MGTVMNGNKWSGACVNGDVVNGLVKNGITFYKRTLDIYKRRIVVGDVFDSNSRIFSDIPDDFINDELPNMGVVDPKQTIITGNNFNIGELYIAGFYRVYIDYDEIQDDGSGYDEQFYVYDVYSYGTMLNIKDITLDKLTTSGVITSVNENVTYRHLYIEDTNIRPLQVGDIITEDTKFYFTIPDNFDEIMSTYKGNIATAILEDNNKFIMTLYLDLSGDISTEVTFSGADSFQVYYKQGTTYFKNISSAKNIGETNKFIGTVATVNKSNPGYNYILVDKNTLG